MGIWVLGWEVVKVINCQVGNGQSNFEICKEISNLALKLPSSQICTEDIKQLVQQVRRHIKNYIMADCMMRQNACSWLRDQISCLVCTQARFWASGWITEFQLGLEPEQFNQDKSMKSQWLYFASKIETHLWRWIEHHYRIVLLCLQTLLVIWEPSCRLHSKFHNLIGPLPIA